MRIERLTDRRDLLGTVAGWIFSEWPEYIPEDNVSDFTKELSQRIRPSGVDSTYVALQDGLPVGCASLVADDLPTRKDLSPWLAEVYVVPEHRHQGIGRALVAHVTDQARMADIETLYLYTPDKSHFYVHMGWKILEQTEYMGKGMTIMSLSL